MNKRTRLTSLSHDESCPLARMQGISSPPLLWSGTTTSPSYAPSSPAHSPLTECPAYRPTSPCHLSSGGAGCDGSFSPQYAPISLQPKDSRLSEALRRIESSDPSFVDVVFHDTFNPHFGHPEYEHSHLPVFSDDNIAALQQALSRNTCITGLDLSRLALGGSVVGLMRSLTHLTSLSALNFQDNFHSDADTAQLYKCAAEAGMTCLRQLLCLRSSCSSPRAAATCAEWLQLRLPPLPLDFNESSDSVALLHLVISSIIARHASSSISTSLSLTFPPPSSSRPPVSSPTLRIPHILSHPQCRRLLATGGIARLFTRRVAVLNVRALISRSAEMRTNIALSSQKCNICLAVRTIHPLRPRVISCYRLHCHADQKRCSGGVCFWRERECVCKQLQQETASHMARDVASKVNAAF
jgi:hypothetical protein